MMMLHCADSNKINKIIDGWKIEVTNNIHNKERFILITPPSWGVSLGKIIPIKFSEPIPHNLTILKSVTCLVSSGPNKGQTLYKEIKILGQIIPKNIKSFIKRIKKASHFI